MLGAWLAFVLCFVSAGFVFARFMSVVFCACLVLVRWVYGACLIFVWLLAWCLFGACCAWLVLVWCLFGACIVCVRVACLLFCAN